MPSHKFFPLAELVPLIENEKQKGKKVALANGGFDLFHIGHVRYLQGAKMLAEILVVALNSDASLQELKGENRALIDELGRIKIISSLVCVDYVTLFDELKVERVLLALRPHFHCKGSDYTVETVPEMDVVKGYGGQVAIVGGEKIRSASRIIQEIKQRHIQN